MALGIVEIAYFNIVSVASSGAYHVHLMVVFHLLSDLIDQFVKRYLWKHHESGAGVNDCQHVRFFIFWVHHDLVAILESPAAYSQYIVGFILPLSSAIE